VRRQVGATTTVYRAAHAITPYAPITRSDLEPVTMPARWTSPGTRLALGDLEGRRIGFRVQPGTVISKDMLVEQSAIGATEREITIDVDPVTGLGGDVDPGDGVDVYAVFGDVAGLPKQVRVLVRDARVVSVGGERSVRQSSARGGISQGDVVPVTLALEQNEALSVTYAGAFATEVRLVGLPKGTDTGRAKGPSEFDAGGLGGEAVPEGGVAPEGGG
jgi:pilus assembly protein CpaB